MGECSQGPQNYCENPRQAHKDHLQPAADYQEYWGPGHEHLQSCMLAPHNQEKDKTVIQLKAKDQQIIHQRIFNCNIWKIIKSS